ncbi:ABC transporter ATP-binding protein [Pseudonocardia sp. GCM10023141]|uniref:ABC transporter ATP-binding protein n=1 Tax=Pseudonocardia sp. GCM10023141 TaxID=3252653 RepID=UPI003618F0C8
MTEHILEAEALHASYLDGDNATGVLRGVDLKVGRGAKVGLVGESGSGKSTFARLAVGLVSPTTCRIDSGRFCVDDTDIVGLSSSTWESRRGDPAAIVFQDPLSYLNPVLRVGFQIAEAVRRHDGHTDVAARVRELLASVQLPARTADAYPHELSGGMRQRCLMAMALGCRPKLLIADEPTTALDVTTQSEILALLERLVTELDMALLLISHDLAVVSQVCAEVNVMYAGKIVESGPTGEIFRSPQHPYTRALLAAARMERHPDGRFVTVGGDVTALDPDDRGCHFRQRCVSVEERCEVAPPRFEAGSGQQVACWLVDHRVVVGHA